MINFFSFEWAQKRGEALVESLTAYDEKKLVRGKLFLNAPLQLKINEGKKLYDIVHFQDPYNFAISDKVFKLLNNNNITGWKSYEIEIENQKEKYYGFQVLGRCGNLRRPEKAGFVKGYEFEYESWDSSDFFMPDDTFHTFCTEKAEKLLRLNKITNLMLEPINSIEWYSV